MWCWVIDLNVLVDDRTKSGNDLSKVLVLLVTSHGQFDRYIERAGKHFAFDVV